MASKPLTDLSPLWIWWGKGRLVESLSRPEEGMEVVGVTFDCPTCDPPHNAAAYWKSPFGPESPVWLKSGDSFEDLTLYPSMDATEVEELNCSFKGWLRKGQVTW